jgi:hypothetical protein
MRVPLTSLGFASLREGGFAQLKGSLASRASRALPG